MFFRLKVLAIVFFLAIGLSSAAVSMDAQSEGNSKIKRMVSDLSNKSKAADAQRNLENYGSEVVEYVVPIIK